VPHLSLINWLCEEVDSNLYVNDLSAPMMKPMTDTHMDIFVRDFHERLHNFQVEEATSAHPQPQPQQPPPQQQFVQGGREQPVGCLCTYSSYDAGLHVWPFQLDE